jgi:hypothetical protein
VFAGSPRYAIAHCGYPIEHLIAVPGLDWEQVLGELRCTHCAAAARPIRP